jgi:transposase
VLTIPPSVHIFLASQPADMRWSFDRLAAMTKEVIGQDPLSGHLFVFRNRRGDRIKILFWDRSGYCLWYKRLEKGVFKFPDSNAKSIEVEAATLALILEGIDLAGARHRQRFVLRPDRALRESA